MSPVGQHVATSARFPDQNAAYGETRISTPTEYSRRAPLRSFIQFLAHVFEQFRVRLGRIFADLTRLRHSERIYTMRRVIAFVIHPSDEFATLRMLRVTKFVIPSERRVIPPPLEL
jgi:hypothetical protein